MSAGHPRGERRRFFRLPWRSARQIRADVDEEFRFHLDMRLDALVALGLSRDEASARALREFGDLDDARRYVGAVDHDIEAAQRRSEIMNDFWQDLRYSIRQLRITPAFTIAAIVTLALGIGANTAIFSVVNAVLLRPLPFPHADHLVRVVFTQQGHSDAGTPMDVVDYPGQATDFVGFAVLEGTTANLTRDGADAERIPGARVGASWFALLGAKPLAGRFFAAGEDQQQAANVAVISEQLWRRDFSGDTGVVGKSVRINSTPFTIIGVAPAQHYPVTIELWMTKKFTAQELSDGSRGARWLGVLARVKDGVDLNAASAELTNISAALEHRFPEVYRDRRAQVQELQEFMTGSVRKPLFIILGAVALVLLIACANVANLMLVRATAREGEMAVRTALGAGRGRLVRQLMTESVLLSLLGAVAGLGVAKVGMYELLGSASKSLVLVDGVSIDATTLGVSAGIALLTGLLFGILPAVQVTQGDLATALRAGARGSRTRHTAHRAKRLIVVSEVALAVTLLTGAVLLLRSFQNLMSVDTGFRPEGVLSMKVALPYGSYDSTGVRNILSAIETRARGIPGVASVGVSNFIPLDGASYEFEFVVRGHPPLRPSDRPSTEVRQVTPGFFDAMGMPVLRGRGITADDRPGASKVLVVNRAFANQYLPREEAVGQAVSLDWGTDSTGEMRQIVGVVGDVRGAAMATAPEPTVYAPFVQAPDHTLSIVVRGHGAPASYAAPMRAIVRDLDHELPIYSVQTMEERIASSVGQQKFYAMLLVIFAAVALALAAVGLYGVIAYAVSQRTHELGVRVALGATTDRISRMVIGEGLVLSAAGAVIGIVTSVAAGRVMATLLFGVNGHDPTTLASVAVLLALVAVLASWIPARRAARVDPLVAMRGD